MYSKNKPRHMIDILFVLSLFCLFAVSSVVLILFGADIYKKTVSSMDTNYAERTSTAYITEKIRRADIYDSIYIDEKNGCQRLMLTQEIEGITYATALYEYGGYLYELFSRTDIELTPDSGQQVIAMSDIKFEFAGEALLKISFADEYGKSRTVYVSLHCKRKGA